MKTSSSVARGRRHVLRTMGTTIAAAVAAPSFAVAGQHEGHASTAQKAGTVAPAAPATAPVPPPPSVLDEHERATLAALGDQLVPGSSAAGVPALIDRVLATDSTDGLRRFRNALGAFEREARMRHGRTWLSLSAEQRLAVLREAAAMPPAVAKPAGWTPGAPVLPKAPAAPPPPPTLRDYLEDLRGTVARAYVSTEAGAADFGSTGAVVFEGLPTCSK
jgi:hypothetical protein